MARKQVLCLRAAVILAIFFMGATTLRAQTPTTVTATVVDPNAIPYAGGTVKAQLVPTPPGGPCVITGGNCVPVPGTAGPVLMSTTGGFTMNLYPNASILCGGQACTTQWSFQVCISPGVLTPFGTGPQCFSVSQTIAGSTQDISAALKAGALALTVTPNFSGGGSSWANITAGTNTHAGAFVSTAGNYNFSGISLFQLPAQPSFSTSSLGQIGFDTTNNNWHANLNPSDAVLAPFASTPTNGDCLSAGNTAGHLTLTDTGSPCSTAAPIPVRTGIVLASYTQTQAANVALTSTNVFQTILSQNVVFPPSCPCQVRIHWNLYPTGGGGTPSFSAGVEDGSGSGNLIAASQNASGGNTGGMSSSQLSPQTYTGSVNFSLVVANSSSPASSSINANPVILPTGYGAPGFLNVEVVQPASDGVDQAIVQSILASTAFPIGPITPATLNEVPIALVVGDAGSGLPTISPGAGASVLTGALANGSTLLTTTIASPTTVNATANGSINMASVLALLRLSGTFTNVQQTTAANTTGTSTSKAFAVNTTAGHVILAVLTASNVPATQTTVQVTDTQGNQFVPVGSIFVPSGGGHDAIQATMFIATNTKGGADTVTWTTSQSFAFGLVQALEFSGVS